MSEGSTLDASAAIERVYRAESRRVLASLIRLLGDFDRAEEALHDAFAAAVQQWPANGVPANPRAWLVSAGRFRTIDAARRDARFDASQTAIADGLEQRHAAQPELDDESLDDDWLRLIFTCCHPALSADARIALTLREVCDLTTEQVARAFLSTPPTIAQRIVRAKAKIRDARIPYAIPTRADMPERLDAVLHVIYLVFNEGYAATSGDAVVRTELTRESIRLGHLLLELLPGEGEVAGLLALMLLHDSRRLTRTTTSGEIALLTEQDRRLWDRVEIEEGARLVERAMRTGRVGPYTVQAAIAALHAEAPSAEETDWGADRGVVRRADAHGADTDRRAEPCGGGRDARRGAGWPRIDGRDPRARRARRVSPRARRAGRPARSARPPRGGDRGVRPSACARCAGARAEVPGAKDGGTAVSW
jgi:RNA polymerase sigma-70 factor (ECF subfamily)